MPRKIDVEEFAKRVERLCDFFLDKLREESSRDDSPNVKVLEKLKEDAADLQFNTAVVWTIDGLDDYMKGSTK